MTSSVTTHVTPSVTDGVSHTSPLARGRTPSRPDPSRPNPTPTQPSNAKADMALRDYDAYLDSMLAHLGRVHTAATIRYHWRRLEEARAA